MILVWGEAHDEPVARVLAALAARGADTRHLDDVALAELRHDIGFDHTGAQGWLQWQGQRVSVHDIRGAYLRPGPAGGTPAHAAKAVPLLGLMAALPGVVVNRPAAGRSNHSKPYQSGVIARAGLDVPDTLLTTDPDAARRFVREHGCVVYKSLSSVRSIVATLQADRAQDMTRLDGVRSGPVQLQAYVAGTDVRVHVVDDRCFACAVESSASDYRYAAKEGANVELREIELPDVLCTKLVALTRSMGLLLSGIDMRRRNSDGRWVCFEVNPSPGFPWYEDTTGHPIAEHVAALLDADGG